MKHHVSPEALRELCESALYLQPDVDGASEARVQSEIRLAAARRGIYLYRNNRGAATINGAHVRFGLANDSKKFGAAWKSGDLVGWETIMITEDMVGSFVARFLSVEAKRRNWKFSGSLEDMAQTAWATLVNSRGGRAIITNTADTL